MTLHAILRRQAAATPDKVALHYDGALLDYRALHEAVESTAGGLAAQGVGAGDRVAVLAHNHPATLVLLFACSRLGAMLLPLNWRLARPELDWMLADAAPRVLVMDAANRMDPPHGVLPLERGALPTAKPGPDTGTGLGPLLLVYTSGTTGRPKGAVLSGRALLANAALSRDMHGLTAADHVLTVLPLFHVGGLNIQTLPALLAGATVTLHARFEPADMLAVIAAARPTLTVLVPAMMQAVIADPAWPGADLSSLRALTTGSTVVQPAVIAPFRARGVPVLQVYGSTETAPIAIYTRLGQVYGVSSTGHPGPGCSAEAVDEDGGPLPPGTAGEIRLRGPQLFDGYWSNASATAEVLQHGWYRTGDIGTQAPDGSWTVHDRCKNVIISGGENIYPAEVERVLHEMPGVLDAAVVARPDARWQEVPEAFVVLRPGSECDEATILAHARAQLARFKVPRRVHVVPSLPRNAMGKVQHTLLQALTDAHAD